ncbi:MAG TPA: hypothetical protein VKE22_08890 [Haliangiales bacterium]|nr:hypothetical protein [Haliangiales bacterium]
MRTRILWLVLALPGVAQMGLLLATVARRLAYPYDLEWMEGGMLVHAWRLMHGLTIYPAPSVDFIPYLYTPGYPAVLAALGKVFGLGYPLGRAVSAASLVAVLGLAAWAVVRPVDDDEDRGPGIAGAAVAGGIVAATYPWVEGWYDLVRGDTLFLAVALAGLVVLRRGARRPRSVALAAALLGASFFLKQTGVILVAAGGAALLVLNWRAVPVYIGVAGAIGGGGTLLLNRLTDGWFWVYIYQVHQQHDTNMDRFWRSFGNMFGKFPALTAVFAATLVAVTAAAIVRRRLPAGAGGFLYWLWIFACGAVMGALGWATQWAHFNAYIPAMTFGGIAAGAALPALAGCVGGRLRLALPGVAAAALALQLALAWWSPRPLLPAPEDRAAGDRLIARLAAVPGDVFIPSHPFYAVLAGKAPHVHRMGILDVTTVSAARKPLPPRAREVAGLEDALRSARFAAVILDDKGAPHEYPGLTEAYRIAEKLPPTERPRVVSGAESVPFVVWTPKSAAAPPLGARIIGDFESGTLAGWTVEGKAWSAAQALPGREVGGFGGRWFATSFGGGDAPQGTLLSPPFAVTGRKIVFHLAGGSDAAAARAELRVVDEGKAVRTATSTRTLILQPVEWDVSELRGKTVQLAFVDAGSAPWGGLCVDDVWEVP